MKYDSEKQMLFAFLSRIDYNQDWEDIKYGMGYDLGDYAFEKIEHAKIYRLARLIHTELQGEHLGRKAVSG